MDDDLFTADIPPVSDADKLAGWEAEIAAEDANAKACGYWPPNIGEGYCEVVAFARQYFDETQRLRLEVERAGHVLVATRNLAAERAEGWLKELEELRAWQERVRPILAVLNKEGVLT